MTSTSINEPINLSVVRADSVWAEAGDYMVDVERHQGRHSERIGAELQFDDIVLHLSRVDGNADTVAICCDDPVWLDVLRRARKAIDHAEAALRQAGYVDDLTYLRNDGASISVKETTA